MNWYKSISRVVCSDLFTLFRLRRFTVIFTKTARDPTTMLKIVCADLLKSYSKQLRPNFYSIFTSPSQPSVLDVERTSIALNADDVANRYHSRNQRIYKEKFKTRNEVPYAEVWIGKLRQNTTRRKAPWNAREHCKVRREVLLWGFVLGWNTQFPLYAYEK